ncbi:hypothetical protein PZA11_000942 [Diplocarpon coronariae]
MSKEGIFLLTPPSKGKRQLLQPRAVITKPTSKHKTEEPREVEVSLSGCYLPFLSTPWKTRLGNARTYEAENHPKAARNSPKNPRVPNQARQGPGKSRQAFSRYSSLLGPAMQVMAAVEPTIAAPGAQ